jgi:hypothetical protein
MINFMRNKLVVIIFVNALKYTYNDYIQVKVFLNNIH